MYPESAQDYFVYLLIALFIGYAIYFFLIKKESVSEQWQASALKDDEDETPVVQPKDEDLVDMTLEEISVYNGKDQSKIYIGVKNIVFDCTSQELYREGGSYHLFAGKDASVSLSRMSFEEKDLNTYNTEKLNMNEIEILDEWFEKFNFKYLRVGRLVSNKKDE